VAPTGYRLKSAEVRLSIGADNIGKLNNLDNDDNYDADDNDDLFVPFNKGRSFMLLPMDWCGHLMT
jgi:hypothetical protein